MEIMLLIIPSSEFHIIIIIAIFVITFFLISSHFISSQQISHPNICELEMISLRDFKLYLLFPYIENTLHDFLNPQGEPNSGHPLSKSQVQRESDTHTYKQSKE